MNVSTISMPKEDALAAYREYREHMKTDQDSAIMMGYKAIAGGKTLINLREAILKAGFDELYRPRLAVARADMAVQHWECSCAEGKFSEKPAWTFRYPERRLVCKGEHYDALVPFIPPKIRPGRTQLRHYWILWEAAWKDPPKDPLLLRHLSGDLYVVLASWDLTELERAAMRVAT